MNVYPITFILANGTTITGELVTDVSLSTDFWTLVPATNGNEYSGYPGGVPPQPTWTTVPNLLNQNASVSVNILTTYVTPTTGVTLALSGSLPTGWAFNTGTNLLTYNGSSVSGPNTVGFVATLTATGLTTASNNFVVSGVGSTTSDVTAPTVPLGIAVTGITISTATVGGFASSDPAPSGATWSGLQQYNVVVTGATGSPFTVTQGPGNEPVLTTTQIGTLGASTVTQSGSSVTFTTTVQDNPYPTSSGVAVAYQQLTGTSWVLSAQITSFSSTGLFDSLRLEARTNLTPTGPYVAVWTTPTEGVGSDARPTAGGNAANLVTAANTTFPVWLYMVRSGDTYSFYWSIDGNTLQSLGATTQVMGNPLYVAAGANTQSGGPMTAQSMAQVNIQTLPNWSLNLTGLSANTSYPVKVTSQDIAGNVSANSATVNFTTSGGTSAKPFPRFGQLAQLGSTGQIPNTSTMAQASQYPFWLFGGNYPNPFSGYTRDQIVKGVKGQTLTGKSAVLPVILQYDNPTLLFGSANDPELNTIVGSNNWWLYTSGSSGTKATAPLNGNNANVFDICRAVGTDTSGFATGLYAGQLLAKYMYERYITGAIDTTVGASTSLDGLWMDNFQPYLIAAGDWTRSGSSQAQNNQTASTAFQQGITDYAAYGTANYSGYLWCGNTNFPYSTQASGGQGLNGSQMNGVIPYGCEEYLVGEPLSFTAMHWGGINLAVTWYQVLANSCLSGFPCLITGAYSLTDYQLLRHDLCMTTVFGNGYLCGAMSSNPLTSANEQVDGTNTATWMYCDEFWGGQLATGGYLGQPLSTALGAVATLGSPWSGTVYRRDFTNGIVLINLGTTSQTVSLGGTYYHLRTAYGSQSINNAASATSVTLTTFTYGSTVLGDACVLMNNPT